MDLQTKENFAKRLVSLLEDALQRNDKRDIIRITELAEDNEEGFDWTIARNESKTLNQLYIQWESLIETI